MIAAAMGHDRHPGFAARHRLALAAAGVLLFLLTAVVLSTEVSLNGSFEGLYLLHGRHRRFEVRTDLFLDEEQRLIFAFPYKPVLSSLTRSQPGSGRALPFLEYTWNDASGDGFVVSHLDAGNLLIVNWSRFLDDEGKPPDGLFLGGSLPYPLTREADATLNDTGMAYFDGKRWYHAWCSVNELVSPAANPTGKIFPSSWEFLGSSVLSAGADHLLLTSRHRVRIDGVPVLIQKWVSLRAGDLYFTMATRFENVGTAPTAYFYLYGDEP